MTEPALKPMSSDRLRGRTVGARIRRGAALLTCTVALSIAVGFSQVPVRAADEALTAEQIADFESKLAQAREAQTDATKRLGCLDQQDQQLVIKRDQDQLRLGELVRRKNEVEATLIRQRAEYDSYKAEFDQANQRFGEARNRLHQLQQIEEAKQAALRKCSAEFGFLGFLCVPALKTAELIGAIPETEKLVAEESRRLADAAAARDAAASRFRESEAAFAASDVAAATANKEIKAAEASISALDKALATLRPSILDNKKLLDEFADALNEAKTVDTADGRGRTARRVRDLAKRVVTALQGANTLLASSKAALAQYQLTACF
ncbi:hypothetical protein KQX62_08145 [Rhodopseudomonas palustris]|uniref:Uncharacterized protein n=1 Tax=Rhodopseudomonas palustris TaxID=1076 RepID=A0AAX3E2P9_RHOPL|nr:hypothetical protein [Rhodopseudomonas palustris]UYO41249.1 hypothetical protein KQX62_08145 [Rhodopseudomonas palustris]